MPNAKFSQLPVPVFCSYLPRVFFRTKQIKGNPLLQLVEAYRNAEGQPRQRVVASLGNITLPEGDSRRIAKAVADQINGQPGLLDGELSAEAASWVDHIANLAKRSKGATDPVRKAFADGVLLDGIETEQALVYRQLGIDWKQAAPTRKYVRNEDDFVVPSRTEACNRNGSRLLIRNLG